jgi:hypothetical protein
VDEGTEKMDETVQEKALLFDQVKQVFLRRLDRQLNYGRSSRYTLYEQGRGERWKNRPVKNVKNWRLLTMGLAPAGAAKMEEGNQKIE